jgi:hypothetical protein
MKSGKYVATVIEEEDTVDLAKADEEEVEEEEEEVRTHHLKRH